MTGRKKANKWILTALRWSARIVGAAMTGLIIFVGAGDTWSGQGLPNPFNQPLSVALEVIGFIVCLAGLIIAWRWARLGGVLILAGMLTFHVVECKVWLNWVFLVLELVGFGHLCTWLLSRRLDDLPNKPKKNRYQNIERIKHDEIN